jgi:hypothetical protein
VKAEAQRIAIAEACGFERDHSSLTGTHWHKGAVFYLHELPDYLSDLNAMHEAEKALPAESRINYPMQLLHIIWRPEPKLIPEPERGWWQITTHEMPMLLGATAAQRAEAFLRTLGKWEESA